MEHGMASQDVRGKAAGIRNTSACLLTAREFLRMLQGAEIVDLGGGTGNFTQVHACLRSSTVAAVQQGPWLPETAVLPACMSSASTKMNCRHTPLSHALGVIYSACRRWLRRRAAGGECCAWMHLRRCCRRCGSMLRSAANGHARADSRSSSPCTVLHVPLSARR